MIDNVTVIRIVRKVCNECGVTATVLDSLSTNSLYFTIRSGRGEVHFRISDHGTKRSIRSLIIQKHTKRALVERFVRNCIEKLRLNSLHHAFELISASQLAVCS